MTKLEVQYAVRVPLPDGRSMVLAERYADRKFADRIVYAHDRLVHPRKFGAEVVAQVVMVAGDWTDPDTAEATVRDQQNQEQVHETMEVPGGIVKLDRDRAQLSAEQYAEIVARWRELYGDGSWRGKAHVIEPIKLDGEADDG